MISTEAVRGQVFGIFLVKKGLTSGVAIGDSLCPSKNPEEEIVRIIGCELFQFC